MSRALVIEAERGLCNRLRAVLSYAQVAAAEGRQLLVVWRADAECNGHFDSCFAPLAGVRFTTRAPAWDPSPELASCCHPNVGAANEIASFARLVPIAVIAATVAEHVRALGAFVSVHIRRTDLIAHHGAVFAASVQTTDALFAAFLDRYAAHNVHIASCCALTRGRFRALYSARLADGVPTIAHDVSGPLRQTSLADAVVDMYVCAAAEHFLGSRGSSFSDTVDFLRSHNRPERAARAIGAT